MRWAIPIDNFLGGFAPAWYKETYPSYGNKNQAGAMRNIDLTNAGYMTQGPGLAALTNGTQAAAVTTLIKGMIDYAVTADTSYGIGGNRLYKFSSTAVTSDGTWPHVIDKAAVTDEDGESVVFYKGDVYYFYNHSGTAGDIGTYDLASAFDDDWGSTVPSGSATLVGGVPHPSCVGGNDTFAFGNGRYVGTYDGTTLQTQALDLPEGTVVVSIKWKSDRWWITANRPNLSGSNKNTASIYIWDGTTDSWETEITLMGTAGASHVRNGVLFQFYRDISSVGGYKLGYVDGITINDLCNYSGTLPEYYQITDFKDFFIWRSDDLIFAYGGGDKNLPVRIFQIADGGYSTVGGLACPFGTPIVASTESTSYQLAQFSGVTTDANWKSMMFDVTGEEMRGVSNLDRLRINFETLASGARVDVTLRDRKGAAIFTDTISFSKQGAVNGYTANINKNTANFRVELDFTNGSTTNPVKINNIRVYGTTI